MNGWGGYIKEKRFYIFFRKKIVTRLKLFLTSSLKYMKKQHLRRIVMF